jgi:hypothetical protein
MRLGFYGALTLLGLGGCAEYQITLNEQPIYTPPPLYSQYEVADEALRNCLRQTILDQRITQADQLSRLICRHAGIESLQGLETFVALEELDISHNALRDLSPLQNLPKLRLLRAHDNPELLCDSLPVSRETLEIMAPAHCTE